MLFLKTPSRRTVSMQLHKFLQSGKKQLNMSLFSFSSLSQRIFRISAGLGLALSGFTATADIAVWEFNDSANRGLTLISNSVSEVAFDTGASGVRTNGKGVLEIRRALGTSVISNAQLEPIRSGKVWMQLDIAGWDLYGEPTEELSFGFSEESDLNEAVAVLEWKRLNPSNVWFFGRAEGIGSTDAAIDEFLPRRHPEALSYVLECDLDRYTYEIYKKEGSGRWLSVGRGAIAEGAEINYFGIRINNRFQEIDDEYFHIDRLALTREDPIDRENWEPIAEHPFITAWSWAVADAETGEIIAGEELDTPRKSASVTKAMTTHVVCELAKEDPSILDEMVQFSALALQAVGSTANIEEGESLPLREALFAFMLPSGNAVGNAIAEHFHGRLPVPEGTKPGEKIHPRASFIAKMNEEAARLGMTDTIYRSAFGDGGSSDERTTTVRDLIKFAQAAMENELFREVVGTKEYSTEVTKADGSIRIASWTNTNQLLGTEGYNGIKTGTTRTARACLLSSAELNNRPLFAVVLGSVHSSRRYVDTRNIMNWVAESESDDLALREF